MKKTIILKESQIKKLIESNINENKQDINPAIM